MTIKKTMTSGSVGKLTLNNHQAWLCEQNAWLQKAVAKQGVLFDGISGVPTSLTPKVINESRYQQLKYLSETVLGAIESVLHRYVSEPAIQALFPELQNFRTLSTRTPAYERWVQVARFDIAETPSGEFKLMETNCDCPGAILWTPLIKYAYEELEYYREFVAPLGPIPQPIDDPYHFVNSLVRVYQKTKNTDALPNIAFLSSEYRPILTDMDLFERTALEMGCNAQHLAVQKLTGGAQGAWFGKHRADIIYQKFDAFIDDHGQFKSCIYEHLPDEVSAFWCGLEEGTFLYFNSFPSIAVAENKRLLALLKEPELRLGFTPEQITAIDEFCPQAFTLNKNDAKQRELVDDVLGNRAAYVIKRIIDTRGRGVTIGLYCTQDDWENAVEQAIDGPYIVQEYIPHQPQPVLGSEKETREHAMFSNLGMFMFDGQAAGLFCRSSPDPITNVARGGAIQPVYVVRDNELNT